MTTSAGLIFSLGILIAAGSGAGSFSVLIGSAARHMPPEKRGMAAGIINAGGSFGQFVFAPITQGLISALGWMGAMWSIAAIALGALPITRALRGKPATAAEQARSVAGNPADKGMKAALRDAMKDRSYLLLHAGFFTCGFHIAFLVTHLPGEVQLCGLSAQVASWSLAIIGLSNIGRQPAGRLGDAKIPQQIHSVLDVRLACGPDPALSRRAEKPRRRSIFSPWASG